MELLNWLKSIFQSSMSLIYPGDTEYPDNEIGDHMRRSLANKTWFDSICALWSNQPFWMKLVIIAGVTLCAGLLGLIIEAPLLFALVTLFLCIGTHVLVTLHEHKRVEFAQEMAEDAYELKITSEATKQLLDEATKHVDIVASKLQSHSDTIKMQEKIIAEKTEEVQKHNVELAAIVDEVKEVRLSLVKQEQIALELKQKTTEQLQDLSSSITQTTESVEGIGSTVDVLNKSVDEFESSQKVYSESAARFCLFVEEESKKSSENYKVAEELLEYSKKRSAFYDKGLVDSDEELKKAKHRLAKVEREMVHTDEDLAASERMMAQSLERVTNAQNQLVASEVQPTNQSQDDFDADTEELIELLRSQGLTPSSFTYN